MYQRNQKTLDEYDVIVVGSGAAGAMSAYVLAMAGVKVLMLEAGRWYDAARETPKIIQHASALLLMREIEAE